MQSISKWAFFVIIVCVFVHVNGKNYEFKVTYQCQNNEFKWYEEKLKNEKVYGCRNWVQKILISQEKNKFVRFENEQGEEEEEIEEDEEKDFEQDEEKEKKEEEEEELKENEEILEEIEKEEKSKKVKEEKQQKYDGQKKSKSQQQQQQHASKTMNNKAVAIPSSPQSKTSSHKFAHRIKSANQHDKKLSTQTKNDSHQRLTHKLANIFHKLSPQSTRHMLTSSYHYIENQNELRHYFQLRHTEEEQEGEKEKFKPIKAHRSHPIQDVMFLLELIEMNSIILQNTYQVRYEDVPTVEELKEKLKKLKEQQNQKPKQQQQAQKSQKKQQKEHDLATTITCTMNHLRSNL